MSILHYILKLGRQSLYFIKFFESSLKVHRRRSLKELKLLSFKDNFLKCALEHGNKLVTAPVALLIGHTVVALSASVCEAVRLESFVP